MNVHELRKSKKRGQTSTEFAVVASACLIVFFGLMEMANAVYSYHMVATAAREGVRYAIVHSPTSANPASNATIQQVAASYASGLDASQLTVNVTWPADSRLPLQKDAQVQVSYNYPLSIPFMSPVTLSFSSSSRMLVSQ